MEVAIAILALLATVAGILVVYKQNRPAQTLAARELEKRSEFVLKFNGAKTERIVWVLPWKKYRRMYAVDFIVSLQNVGSADLEEVFLEIEIPSELYGPEAGRFIESSTRIFEAERFVDPVRGKEFTKITHKFRRIYQGARVNVVDLMRVTSPTHYHGQVTAPLQDGNDVSFAYGLVLGFEIRLLVAAKNVLPFAHKVVLYFFDEGDEILANLGRDPKAMLNEAISSGEKFETWEPATILFGTDPDLNDAEFPPELRSLIARVRLSEAKGRNATWHPKLGLLPLGIPERAG